MTLLFFGTFAMFIPDAWTVWRLGRLEYRRSADGGFEQRQPGGGALGAAPGLWSRADVRPVDPTLPARRRTGVA